MSTIERFAETLLEQRRARLRAEYPDSDLGESWEVHVVPGRVYTKVNIGPGHNMSGKYMVDNATGVIYGIRGYGKVHKGHQYGTLDTIDDWDWGGYTAVRRGRGMFINLHSDTYGSITG